MARVSAGFGLLFDLEISSDGQWVESCGPEADPEWRFVDGKGHGHFYADGKKRYPTLKWKRLPCSMGHGPECDSEGYYRCRQCGEEITPGTRPSKPVWIAGMSEYRLNLRDERGTATYSFGQKQWDELADAIRTLTRKQLADFIVEMTWEAS